MRRPSAAAFLLAAAVALLPACGGDRSGGEAAQPQPGGATPVDAVRDLNAHLVAGDFAAFARDAVPPAVHARLDAAWREGRTRWPLDELPLSATHPGAVAALAKEDAEATLQRTFDRQFANAAAELRQAATALGLFAVQFIEQHGEYSEAERAHRAQLVAALSAWAADAPLSDRGRATQAIALLAAAARQARLAGAEDFAAAGIDDALRRMTPVVAAGKQALRLYGLDLDADLAAMEVSLQSQTGDTARVRLQYTLAGHPVDTVVGVERRDRRWYVSDFLANAEAAAGAGLAATP
jgi:hypothetical protein